MAIIFMQRKAVMNFTVAGALNRTHVERMISVELNGKNYQGILRHLTHTWKDVHMFITSSDNAVIVGSLTVAPDQRIDLP